jgi:lipopolysaccharide export system permease protein
MILLVSVVLIAIEFFILLINEVSHLGHGDYHLWSAVQFVLLRLPSELYELYPVVCLLGVLLSLSVLANQSELVALRAAGFSLRNMVSTVLFAACWLNVIGLMWGELLAPWALHSAYNVKAQATSQGQALRSHEGLWLKQAGGFVHIKKVVTPGLVHDVHEFQFDTHGRLRLARYAKQAHYQQHHWQLSDVVDTRFRHELTTQHSQSQVSLLTLQPTFLQTVSVAARELTLLQLYDYLQTPANVSVQYALVFWQRCFKPILIAIMMLLAIPFVFTAQDKSSLGARLLLGLSLGFIYYFLQRLLGPICLLYQWPPLVAALIPLLLTLLGGASLYRYRM